MPTDLVAMILGDPVLVRTRDDGLWLDQFTPLDQAWETKLYLEQNNLDNAKV